MTVVLQCPDLPLSSKQVSLLWLAVQQQRAVEDFSITVRCVSEAEIKRLNYKYRHQDKATNVLTFNYLTASALAPANSEHDIALCLEVAKVEAKLRQLGVDDYVALLLVHAFLHATGLDHEQSAQAAAEMARLEKEVLSQAGFVSTNL